MAELRELYQELILDHSRSPHNYREFAEATHQAKGHNPLCGDTVTVYLVLDGDRVKEVGFQGRGCAISKASASLMTDAIKGMTLAELHALFTEFRTLVTDGSVDRGESLGKLQVFSGLSAYPLRVKCATLSWHTLKAAVEAKGDVSIE